MDRNSHAWAQWTASFGDADGFNSDPAYYESVRLGDVNGDHKQDVCVRGYAVLYCSVSNGSGFAAGYTPWSADLGVVQGTLPAQYSATLQLGDVNSDGKADVCALTNSGIWCALSTGTGFGTLSQYLADASMPADTNLRSDPGYYKTLRLVDIDGGYYGTFRLADVDFDGKADACLRSKAGLLCAHSNGTNFEVDQVWQKLDLADAGGWLPAAFVDAPVRQHHRRDQLDRYLRPRLCRNLVLVDHEALRELIPIGRS